MKILVPVDFSRPAKHALQLAVQWARKTNSSIVPLNVVEFPVGAGSIDPTGAASAPVFEKEFIDVMLEKAENQMKEFLESADEKVVEKPIIEMGNFFAVMSEYLEKHDYELVVMGTQGATGLKEFFVGSNTEKIVRTADCPVIAVRDAVELSGIKKIVLALAQPEADSGFMKQVKQLQAVTDAELLLLRVNTPNNFKRDLEMRPLLDKLAKKEMLQNYSIHVFNDYGTIEGIMNFAEHKHADMIAMGTHGRTGVGHLLNGSVTENIVNHANRLIWSCKLTDE